MKLVVAVSGGVDSIVMLDILATRGEDDLIVAHVDHGIRADSQLDDSFVRSVAEHRGLTYVSTQLQLGQNASEETARRTRHNWLHEIRIAHQADAIATAHHQDDIIETIFINLIRGTGWRGLCSLRETKHYKRPLLGMSKTDIVRYAIDHDLKWSEDSTNDDMKFLRNRLRHGAVARMTQSEKKLLRSLYDAQVELRQQIAVEIDRLDIKHAELPRELLTSVDRSVGREILRTWLGASYETRRLDDLWNFAKVARTNALWSLDTSRFVRVTRGSLIVTEPDD